MEVLTPGEKLIKIRRTIGANQQDIAGAEISRNLISQIENNKIKLTKNTASIIVKNINTFCDYHGLESLKVSVEYLIESLDEQILRITNKYIKELNEIKVQDHDKKFLLCKIKEVEQFLNSNNVDYKNKSYIFKLISDIYLTLKMINESAYNISLSIESAYKSKDYETVIKLMLEESKREYDNENTQDNQLKSLRLALAIYEENNISNEILFKRLYFNIALRYFKLRNFSSCISYLDVLCNKVKLSPSEELDIKLLKATCFEDSGNYDEAESLYLNVLQLALEKEQTVTVSKIYNSLGTLYRLKYDRENSIKYINASLLIKNNIPERNYTRTLYFALENFIELNIKDEVLKYYRVTLNALEKINNVSKYKDIVLSLYSYFKDYNFNSDIDYLLTKIEINIKTNFIKEDGIINIFFKYAYDIRNVDKYKCESIMKKAIELINYLEQDKKVSRF